MKKIWPPLLTTPLWVFSGLPGIGMTGPLDQIRNLTTVANALKRSLQAAEGFQFSHFKLTQRSDDRPEAWSVDL